MGIRAADDFEVIGDRLKELRRERGIAEPAYDDDPAAAVKATAAEIDDNAEYNIHGDRIGHCGQCRCTWSPCSGGCL